MRQCVLRYVLLLLLFPWVRPNTRSQKKLKQYFFVLACDKMCSLKYWITVKPQITE